MLPKSKKKNKTKQTNKTWNRLKLFQQASFDAVFSKNSKGGSRFPTLKEKKNCLAPSSFLPKKKSVSSSNSCTFHTSAFMANNEILQKKKMNKQSAKMPQNAPFACFFSNIFSGRSPETPPQPNCKGIFPNVRTPPYRSEVGLQPPPLVNLVLDPSLTMQCIFLMQF